MGNRFYTDGQLEKVDLLLEQNGVTPDKFQRSLSTPVLATLAEAMATVDLTKVDIAALRSAYGLPKDLGLTKADFPLWKWVEYREGTPFKDGSAILTKATSREVELVRIFPQVVGLDYESAQGAVIRLARRLGFSFCPKRVVERLPELIVRDDLIPAGYLVCATGPNEAIGISTDLEPRTGIARAVIGSETGHHHDWSVIMAR